MPGKMYLHLRVDSWINHLMLNDVVVAFHGLLSLFLQVKVKVLQSGVGDVTKT